MDSRVRGSDGEGHPLIKYGAGSVDGVGPRLRGGFGCGCGVTRIGNDGCGAGMTGR